MGYYHSVPTEGNKVIVSGFLHILGLRHSSETPMRRRGQPEQTFWCLNREKDNPSNVQLITF